jgi:hypothetical protein
MNTLPQVRFSMTHNNFIYIAVMGTIILTVVISSAAAILFPRKTEA